MRVVLWLMWLLHWLPLPLLGRLGNILGYMLFFLAKTRRHIALTNLGLCFPAMSQNERYACALRHFQVYMRSVLEHGILWWASEDRLKRLIVVKSATPLETLQSRQVIYLCPHFVGLDVAGVALALLFKTPGCSIYARQSNPCMDDALRKGRSRFQPMALFSRSEGIKPILRAMRSGLPFFMCPDMDFGMKDAAFIPFFGVAAATLTAPARLAALTGADIVPVTATLLPDYRGWTVEFHPVWLNNSTQNLEDAALRMNQFIEEQVLKAPTEYLWTHRRFKTRPHGQPDPYAHSGAYASVMPAGLSSAAQTAEP